MPEEIINRLRTGLDSFNRTGQIDPRLFDPEVQMIQASSIIDTAGSFHGRSGLTDAMGELQEAFDEMSFEVEEVHESPDGRFVAFVRVRGRGKGSGIEMDNAIAWLLTIRDDRITRLVVFEERDEVLKAVGVSESDS